MSNNTLSKNDLKVTEFNEQKSRNSINSTVDSSQSQKTFVLVNEKLKNIANEYSTQNSREAISIISKRLKISPITYLSNKSVVLFEGEEKRKIVVKFVKFSLIFRFTNL